VEFGGFGPFESDDKICWCLVILGLRIHILGDFHVTRIGCITNTNFPGLHLCSLSVSYSLLESLFSLRDCYSTNPVDTENHRDFKYIRQSSWKPFQATLD